MVKETHTKGGYLFALLALPFIDNEYLSSYELIYRFILLIIYMYFLMAPLEKTLSAKTISTGGNGQI